MAWHTCITPVQICGNALMWVVTAGPQGCQHVILVLPIRQCLLLYTHSTCKQNASIVLSTFLFLSEGQHPLFPSRITLPLESASQGTLPACWSWRLITLIWSHTRQFVISFINTVTIHYSFSLPLQAQNSSFPKILSFIVLLPFHPPAWLHGCQIPAVFIFLRHVGFNFSIVCWAMLASSQLSSAH